MIWPQPLSYWLKFPWHKWFVPGISVVTSCMSKASYFNKPLFVGSVFCTFCCICWRWAEKRLNRNVTVVYLDLLSLLNQGSFFCIIALLPMRSSVISLGSEMSASRKGCNWVEGPGTGDHTVAWMELCRLCLFVKLNYRSLVLKPSIVKWHKPGEGVLPPEKASLPGCTSSVVV